MTLGWNHIISKKDRDKFLIMTIEKGILGLHGGIMGEYNDDELELRLLPEWVPYLDEYDIKYRMKE